MAASSIRCLAGRCLLQYCILPRRLASEMTDLTTDLRDLLQCWRQFELMLEGADVVWLLLTER